ncbi:TPA: replication endonuclease [Klebsiella aerogenes]|nr:replication endonuclease [Klebsiella aerogenes]
MPKSTKAKGGLMRTAKTYSWSAPKKALNPYFDPAEVEPGSELSNLITLYAADNEQEQLRREALSDEVWERYFFNESRDPVQHEMEQDSLISRAKMAREQQRVNPDLVIIADVNAEPSHISKPLLERIKYFHGLGRAKAYSRYLRETIRPCLERLARVRDSQVSASFRFMASHDGLEGLLVLPEMNQDQVKRLSTLVAAHISMCLDAAYGDLFVTDDVKPEEIRLAWERVAAEAMRLDVIPPAFEQLRRKKRRRKPVPYDLIPGSLARMLCADWWYRKLWQMRCEWREEQLRAVCLVNRQASPYVSYEAVIHKREQRRKSLEFFQSHELVNADGDTLDMEDVVNASSSNPAHRRNEMMACVKGLELIAEMRGDCAVFYTITCPSRFHASLNNGRPNPKWTSETVRQSSDYLVDTFAAFRKAMHKAGLRWYGVRVAEPHHDGTVHWHLLCFMRKKDRRTLTTLLRKFAIREDRAELGNNTGPRFKSELINPRKGTPTSYIAKYISKNIDGRGLAKEISKETGKSLRDSAEHVSAWASLHRVQQFRFFGIPGRQAYRELRLLAGQAARQQADKKAGAPVLDNPRLDAVLAAADAGCFATYIMKQGGVLVPRKHHLVRTAYELNDEPSTYGDHGIRIYGIWSPIVEGRICTHAMKWKMVRKAVDVQEAIADQGAGAPWTRGNNCPPVEKMYQAGGELPSSEEPAALPDFENMSKKELRGLTARLRLVKPKRRKGYKQEITEHQRLQLDVELRSRGFDASETEVDLLLRGGSLPSGAGLRLFYRNQRLQEDDKWRQWY